MCLLSCHPRRPPDGMIGGDNVHANILANAVRESGDHSAINSCECSGAAAAWGGGEVLSLVVKASVLLKCSVWRYFLLVILIYKSHASWGGCMHDLRGQDALRARPWTGWQAICHPPHAPRAPQLYSRHVLDTRGVRHRRWKLVLCHVQQFPSVWLEWSEKW